MKVLQGFLVFALCYLQTEVKCLGLDYTQRNDFDAIYQDKLKSLDQIISSVKSMMHSMNVQLSETQKHVILLEDKLKVCGQNNLLIEQLQRKLKASEEASKEYLIRVNSLEDRLVQLEYDHNIHAKSILKRLVSLEKELFGIEDSEEKINKAESGGRSVQDIEKKLENGRTRQFQIKQKSSEHEVVQNDSSSDVITTAHTNASNDDVSALYQWKYRKDKGEEVHSQQETDVATDIFRGFRASTEYRVAFRVRGMTRLEGHHVGERIVFPTLDHSEGGGYHLASGTFTCPTTGTYFFSATIGSSSKSTIFVGLKIEGVLKMVVYAGLQIDNMSTHVTLAHCTAGQSVWLEILHGDHFGGVDSMLGFLLWPDIASS